jgi:RNA polymerase sigma-70 factor, ECF subfamily
MREQRPTTLFVRFRDRGDTRALGELFDALSPELLRVARHLARDKAEAEDLVQATFLTVMEHPERFDASGRVEAWMVGILTNEARAWGRGAARRPDPERVLSEPTEREERERPEQLAVDAESRSLLEAALERLPAKYRDVLTANLLRRQSPQEIAAERDASPATIRVQLHRGLAQLRPLLPAGMAGGLVMTLAPRGSAALRAELLSSASRLTPLAAPAAAGTVTTTTLGGLLMLQRIGIGALVALALAGLWKLPTWLEASGAEGADVTTLSPELRVSSSEALAAAAIDRADESPARASLDPLAATTPIIPGIRVRTLFADGTPAPRIGFSLVQFSDRSVTPRHATTDDQGVALLDVESPEYYALYGDRGGHGSGLVQTVQLDRRSMSDEEFLELREALRVDITLQLQPGVDVSGRVLDREGRPVADAAVWISTGLNRDSGQVVATTDASGRYSLRQLTDACFLGARAEGHAPSKPEHVQYWSERNTADAALELDLQLGGPEATVRGVVFDALGDPLADARVRVGAQDGFDTFGPTGAEGPPPPVEVLTDADGRFEARGITPGQVDVACRAKDHAVRATKLEVRAGESAFAELRLQFGAAVHGKLTTPDGTPVQGATVAVHQSALQYPAARSSFDQPRVETRQDGSFALTQLAPGTVRVSVNTRDRKASDSVTLELADGDVYEWTPQLEGLPQITGVALDSNGESLAGWTVVTRAMDRTGPAPVAKFTDENGRFVLTFTNEGSVQLILHAPDDGPESRMWVSDRVPQAWLDDVETGSRDVQLVLDPAQSPTAGLRADFAMADGSRTPKLLVTLIHEHWGELLQREQPAGALELVLDELPEGTVTLRIEGDGIATLQQAETTLEPLAQANLGVLHLAASGTLRVELTRTNGAAISGLDITLTDANGTAWWLGREVGSLERNDLPAGRYDLQVHATDCGPYQSELQVIAGERTVHHVELAPGGSLGLAFVDANDDPLATDVQLILETTGGQRVCEMTLEPDERGHVSRWIFAPFGELRITAKSTDGRRVEATHRLDASTPSGAPLILRLH